FSSGFHKAALLCAGLCVAGGVLAALGIRNPPKTPETRPEPEPEPCYNCPVSGPPAQARKPAASTPSSVTWPANVCAPTALTGCGGDAAGPEAAPLRHE